MRNGRQPSTRRRLSWSEQRELDAMEAVIMEAEHSRDGLARQLEDPELYRDAAAASVVTRAYSEAQTRVDAPYARWAELEERSAAAQ